MNKLFEAHKLNSVGLRKANEIAFYFDNLLSALEIPCEGSGREMAIVKTKLEEACFFAKKAMAQNEENQESEE